MTTDTYQGWTNRETWIVNLWLTNDETTYRRAHELCRMGSDNIAAGMRLEHFVDSLWLENDTHGFHGMIVDLMNAATSRVNWTEIAASIGSP